MKKFILFASALALLGAGCSSNPAYVQKQTKSTGANSDLNSPEAKVAKTLMGVGDQYGTTKPAKMPADVPVVEGADGINWVVDSATNGGNFQIKGADAIGTCAKEEKAVVAQGWMKDINYGQTSKSNITMRFNKDNRILDVSCQDYGSGSILVDLYIKNASTN